MRETFGSTWTMQLMFSFTLLFVCFLAVTISYSKAFRIRNEVISIIEKNGGYTTGARQIIDDYIKNTGYTASGNCSYEPTKKTYGIKDLNGTTSSRVLISSGNSNQKFLYCISRDYANSIQVSDVIYEVTMFYKFNLPIVGEITSFTIEGKTTDLTQKNDLFDGI